MQRAHNTKEHNKAISETLKRKFALGELHAWNEGLTKEINERVRTNAENIKQNFISGKCQIWNKGLTKENDERLRELSEATRRTMKQNFISGEFQIWNKGLTKEDDERLKKVGEVRGRIQREKFSSGEYQIWNKGLTKETDMRVARMAEKVKITNKLLWQDPEYAQEHLRVRTKGMRKRPTKPEMIMQIILQNLFPDEYKYVGNGEVWLGRRNPDFININGQKKIIEVFGDYWHMNDSGEERIEHFRHYGYDTLIIWEKDLYKGLPKTMNNIIKFHRQLEEQWSKKKDK